MPRIIGHRSNGSSKKAHMSKRMDRRMDGCYQMYHLPAVRSINVIIDCKAIRLVVSVHMSASVSKRSHPVSLLNRLTFEFLPSASVVKQNPRTKPSFRLCVCQSVSTLTTELFDVRLKDFTSRSNWTISRLRLMVKVQGQGHLMRKCDFRVNLCLICTHKPFFNFRYVLLVSTLDGKLSALNVQEDGKEEWSLDVGTTPLLSSSISQLEVWQCRI